MLAGINARMIPEPCAHDTGMMEGRDVYRTMTAAAHELGIDAKSLRKCLDRAGIILERYGDNRRVKAVSDADMARVREVAALLWPARSAPPSATSGHLEDGDIRARMNTLERRMNALEARQHVPAPPPMPMLPPREPSYVRASLDAQTGEVFPQAARARGRWVEARGGPPMHTVRDWPETKDWQSAADAIAGVRARGWPDFMRGDVTAPESRTK